MWSTGADQGSGTGLSGSSEWSTGGGAVPVIRALRVSGKVPLTEVVSVSGAVPVSEALIQCESAQTPTTNSLHLQIRHD